MFRKKNLFYLLIILPLSLSAILVYAANNDTEVIITMQDNTFLAFSAVNNHWVTENKRLSEKVVGKKAKGNIGIVVTTRRIIGFSVLTDKWTSEDLRLNEKIGESEITIEGNVATLQTTERVIGFSAHTGQWIEAP